MADDERSAATTKGKKANVHAADGPHVSRDTWGVPIDKQTGKIDHEKLAQLPNCVDITLRYKTIDKVVELNALEKEYLELGGSFMSHASWNRELHYTQLVKAHCEKSVGAWDKYKVCPSINKVLGIWEYDLNKAIDGTYYILLAEGVDYRKSKKSLSVTFTSGTMVATRWLPDMYRKVITALFEVHVVCAEMAKYIRRLKGIKNDYEELEREGKRRKKYGLKMIDYKKIVDQWGLDMDSD